MGIASVGSHIIRKLRTSLDVVRAPDIRRLIEVRPPSLAMRPDFSPGKTEHDLAERTNGNAVSPRKH
jgi:hypothetical protein